MSTPPQPPQPNPKPLTRFLTALSHSPALLEAFHADPAAAAEPWGLTTDQIELLEDGNLQAVQDAVRTEMEEEGSTAYVGYWIMVAEDSQDVVARRLPDWWIFF